MNKYGIMSILTVLLILFVINTDAQSITGKISEKNEQGNAIPLPGVNVHWLKTTAGTTTNENGEFELSTSGIKDFRLVVSYIGYRTDTIPARGLKHIDISLLRAESQLNTVEISGTTGSSFISELDPRKVQVITSKELTRAACCNLAESFETNSSVDVNYADALTGAKQIQLLGLSGVYSQIIMENVPLVRGLASSFGMGYIPGTWMESIQLSKGASSVLNGFESTTGQINVELKKPSRGNKLFLNTFVNHRGRMEFNADAARKVNERLSTMVLGHFSRFNQPFDNNNDKFMDQPLITTWNFMNRWEYTIPDKFCSQLGAKYLDENRIGGFTSFSPENFTRDTLGINDGTKSYGFKTRARRLESFWKNGIMFKDNDYKSLALIVSGIYHKQDGFFGLNEYDATQRSFNGNLLFQNIIGNHDHKFTTGLSFVYDNYSEAYSRRDFTYLYQVVGGDVDSNPDSLFTIYSMHDSTYVMDRKEIVPGAFFEYTFEMQEKLTLIAGARIDHHNTFKTFFTPRLHIRYKLTPSSTIRASAGKGYRTANIFAENYSIMASQRILHIGKNLDQENAWNMGVNYTNNFHLFKREAQIDLEFYRTSFLKQVIVDLDSLPADAFIYNLDGKSYSHVFQAHVSFEPLKNLTILGAFRFNDVKITEGEKLRKKAMVNSYKGLVTASYTTRYGKWKFDVTTQFNGKARIPDTKKMPALLQRPEYSQEYIQLLAQITRHFKQFEVYIGGENLTNFTQKDPVTEYWRPYHTHFDTSMVWGPIVGATVYGGVRYTIK
jgi:outer membrane receptor protein involved in Fe transport